MTLLAFFIIGVLLFMFNNRIFSGDNSSARSISYNNFHTTSTNGFESHSEDESTPRPHKHDGGIKLTELPGIIENFFLIDKENYELVRTNETMQVGSFFRKYRRSLKKFYHINV